MGRWRRLERRGRRDGGLSAGFRPSTVEAGNRGNSGRRLSAPLLYRAHTTLPGPQTQGNSIADSLAGSVQVAEATHFHSLTHANADGLHSRFAISNYQAPQIIQTCPTCQIFNASQERPEGVNPQGLVPNAIWQMDVTRVPSFGRTSFVHVTIDTASGFLVSNAMTGETTAHACCRLLVCFSIMGLPRSIKTDNGPAYASSKFAQFCAVWRISHTLGFLTIHRVKLLLNVLIPP